MIEYALEISQNSVSKQMTLKYKAMITIYRIFGYFL